MTEREEVKVTVKDKRHTAVPPTGEASAPSRASARVEMKGGPAEASSAETSPSGSEVIDQDYLGDLQRLQAEFENYRKRMMKQQADTAQRAKAKLAESLLPVLDNFERAISHGEGGDGVALVYREFKSTLEANGLEEVPAEGHPFDPTVHEAIQSHEDPNVTEETVVEVHRRGYLFGDQLLRPATVVVGRPPEAVAVEE